MHHGYSVPGVVTGKPIAIGGSLGRADATGQGVVYTIEEAAGGRASRSRGARVAVQGFGNVGEATARLLHQAGARIVGITDIGGGVLRRTGIDSRFLRRYLEEHGIDRQCAGHRAARQRGAVRARRRRARPGRARGPDHGRQRGHACGRGSSPRGPTARSTPEPTRSCARTACWYPGHPVQCRRRDRQLLRVGPEPRGALLDARPDQRRLRRQIIARRRRGLGARGCRWDRARLAAHSIAVERVAEATKLRGLYP